MKTENVVIDEFVGINIPADAWKKPNDNQILLSLLCNSKTGSIKIISPDPEKNIREVLK